MAAWKEDAIEPTGTGWVQGSLDRSWPKQQDWSQGTGWSQRQDWSQDAGWHSDHGGSQGLNWSQDHGWNSGQDWNRDQDQWKRWEGWQTGWEPVNTHSKRTVVTTTTEELVTLPVRPGSRSDRLKSYSHSGRPWNSTQEDSSQGSESLQDDSRRSTGSKGSAQKGKSSKDSSPRGSSSKSKGQKGKSSKGHSQEGKAAKGRGLRSSSSQDKGPENSSLQDCVPTARAPSRTLLTEADRNVLQRLEANPVIFKLMQNAEIAALKEDAQAMRIIRAERKRDRAGIGPAKNKDSAKEKEASRYNALRGVLKRHFKQQEATTGVSTSSAGAVRTEGRLKAVRRKAALTKAEQKALGRKRKMSAMAGGKIEAIRGSASQSKSAAGKSKNKTAEHTQALKTSSVPLLKPAREKMARSTSSAMMPRPAEPKQQKTDLVEEEEESVEVEVEEEASDSAGEMLEMDDMMTDLEKIDPTGSAAAGVASQAEQPQSNSNSAQASVDTDVEGADWDFYEDDMEEVSASAWWCQSKVTTPNAAAQKARPQPVATAKSTTPREDQATPPRVTADSAASGSTGRGAPQDQTQVGVDVSTSADDSKIKAAAVQRETAEARETEIAGETSPTQDAAGAASQTDSARSQATAVAHTAKAPAAGLLDSAATAAEPTLPEAEEAEIPSAGIVAEICMDTSSEDSREQADLAQYDKKERLRKSIKEAPWKKDANTR